MDYLLGLLAGLTHDDGAAEIAFVALVGISVFIAISSIALLYRGLRDPVRRRMERVIGHTRKRVSAAEGVARAIDPVRHYVLPRKTDEIHTIEQRLLHAGFRAPNAVAAFYGVKTFAAIALPVVALAVVWWIPGLTQMQVALALIGSAAVGLVVPSMYLDRAVMKRKLRLQRALPDALDLLVVCSEAGYGLKAGIQRVASELEVSHPDLAEELALVNAEIQAGMDSVEALRNLSVRTGLEDLNGLVSLLTQTLRFGTGIAESLRVYAEEFRDKRMQQAEEKAATIGTKMIFPMVLCLFPAFFVVTVGPAVVGVLEMFGKV